MRARSLLARLSSAAAILIILALALAGFGLRAIFNQEIENRAAGELSQVVKMIAAQVRIDAAGAPALDVALPDPRFDAPYSGFYWQISKTDGQRVRSRSLWDFVLSPPGGGSDGGRRVSSLEGPNDSRVLAVVREVTVPSVAGEVPLQIVAALDRADLRAAKRSFLHLLMLSLAALGVILIIAMSIFIRLALKPFDELGRGLQTIHAGASRSLAGNFPDEVQGVVDDLNRLIAFQDAAVDRAKTHAGDLAHGLKTPLAVLGAIARQAEGGGRQDLARAIEEQQVQMRRQVDRVLARARAGMAAALGRNAVAVAPVADKIMRAFARLPDTKPLDWECSIPPSLQFPGDDGDLTEILGNLLDNARKWATSRIRLTGSVTAGMLTLQIEDDGPGMSLEQAAQIARGRRWDETQPGTGFGLAITRDLAEAYHGALELGRSQLGGLSAVVTIPIALRVSKTSRRSE